LRRVEDRGPDDRVLERVAGDDDELGERCICWDRMQAGVAYTEGCGDLGDPGLEGGHVQPCWETQEEAPADWQVDDPHDPRDHAFSAHDLAAPERGRQGA